MDKSKTLSDEEFELIYANVARGVTVDFLALVCMYIEGQITLSDLNEVIEELCRREVIATVKTMIEMGYSETQIGEILGEDQHAH